MASTYDHKLEEVEQRERAADEAWQVNGLQRDLLDKAVTLDEIESRLYGQWVLLEDPSTDEYMRPTGGKLLWHSPYRDSIYRKGMELKPESSAIWFLGAIEHDREYML